MSKTKSKKTTINGWTFEVALVGMHRTDEVIAAIKKGLEEAGAKHVNVINVVVDG